MRWHTWRSNGQKESEGEFTDGTMRGKWKVWDDDGRMCSDNEYYKCKYIIELDNMVFQWLFWGDCGQNNEYDEDV